MTEKTENKATTIWDDLENKVFTKSNMIFLVWFLAIYFIAYFVLKLVLKENAGGVMGYMFDLVMFVLLVIILVAWYYSTNEKDRNDIATTSLNQIKNYLNEKASIFVTLIFIILLYIFSYLMGLPVGSQKPITLSIIETIAWTVLLITILVQFFQYIFNVSLLDEISKLWNGKKDEKEETKKEETEEKPIVTDEVFNIANNLYTYDDAQAVCGSYGARLATYDEIEEAYKKGGEWCNYGWSDGQMIFFPTQKSTWDKLQKTSNHKNDCGRPGINGGYIKNPYVRFGVNCYGKKPKATDAELNRMNANKNIVHPKSKKDLLLEKKVQFWKDNSDKLLSVNSFNRDKWSQY